MVGNLEHKPLPKFEIRVDREKCRHCRRCVVNCSYDALSHNGDRIISVDENCVGCLRCVLFCPQETAITVHPSTITFNPHGTFTQRHRKMIRAQASTGGVLLSSMGLNLEYPVIFDDLVLDACQVTNPSIDPLREPVETRVFFGRKPDYYQVQQKKKQFKTEPEIAPYIELPLPIIIAQMSFGSISHNAYTALLRAAAEVGTLMGTGEGGLHPDFLAYSAHINSEVASGRFGIDQHYLKDVGSLEIKIGQGAKPGHGGHLPGEKVSEIVSETRMIPEGSDALSPYPHHDIYSIEDLAQLIGALKESTRYKIPVGVKIAAVHNSAPIASGIVRAGADFITLDGFRGGTGAAPRIIRDHAGIPIEVAIASVDQRLREEGIRDKVTLVAGGSIRCSADMVKAIALGADVVMIGTAALVALGCTVCQSCHLGLCSWGIATQRSDLVARLDPNIATEQVVNLMRAWTEELREILGAMGIDSVESLRGNRERLRYIGPNPEIANVLGVLHAGL